jgi:hypothetical protein
MTNIRNIEETEVAKMIRKLLKDKFPGTKFSVKTHKYSGGSSIDVSYTDGPALSNVENFISHFKGATFNGMEDIKEYHKSDLDGETVRFANDFLFIERHYSEQVYKDYATWHNGFYGDSEIRYVEGRDTGYGYQSGYCDGDHNAVRQMREYLRNTGF